MKVKLLIVLAVVLVLTAVSAIVVSAVSGAGFTTFNPWVDGLFKDVCKNSLINCNIYGAKPDVWINGGPAANGLGPDGQYFFVVMEPGGQRNPNDTGPKNLSDDYDTYTDRTFTVTNGEISYYGSTKHDQDSGNFLDPKRPYCNPRRGCLPDGKPPLIRLYPFADTTNPGGVYILGICSLAEGYPVDPRDCKYDAFKVKGMPASFLLSGVKFLDVNGDGRTDWVDGGYEDPGLQDWDITIKGTGFLGEPIDVKVSTGTGGLWEYQKDYLPATSFVAARLQVCEVLKTDWTQSYPDPKCYDLTIQPSTLAKVPGLDFGNGKPAIDVEKTCTAVVPVGTPIDYAFDVTNTGNVKLVNVDVHDPVIGFDNAPNIILAPAGTQQYTAQVTVKYPTKIDNTVYASGDYGTTTVLKTVSDSDICTTYVVDARISIRESDTNSITEPHTFTVKVEKNDGMGWTPASGVIVALTEAGVGDITAETCTSGTDAKGECTVTVNSSLPGSSTVNASATVTVRGVDIYVATDGYGAYYVSNVKTWVAGSLLWYKYDNAGQLLGGATFEVCRTHDRLGTDIADECVTVLDNAAPDADPANGVFKLTLLKLGRYTVRETIPPAGYKGDPYVWTVELTFGAPDAVATHKWINKPYEGCTPGFWQGGTDGGQAGGKWLWNEVNDPQWVASGGTDNNPYIWTTRFNSFFTPYAGLAGFDMMSLVGTGGGSVDAEKAGRDLVAAYLNSSWGMTYRYTAEELGAMWASAVASGDFMSLHLLLDAANNINKCPISASGY